MLYSASVSEASFYFHQLLILNCSYSLPYLFARFCNLFNIYLGFVVFFRWNICRISWQRVSNCMVYSFHAICGKASFSLLVSPTLGFLFHPMFSRRVEILKEVWSTLSLKWSKPFKYNSHILSLHTTASIYNSIIVYVTIDERHLDPHWKIFQSSACFCSKANPSPFFFEASVCRVIDFDGWKKLQNWGFTQNFLCLLESKFVTW